MKAPIAFNTQSCAVCLKGQTIAEGYQAGNLYWLALVPNVSLSSTAVGTSLDTWHLRMAHLSKDALRRVSVQEAVKGMHMLSSKGEEGPCQGCELGKSHRLPFPPSSKHTTAPLEIIHSDLVGPFQTKSIQGTIISLPS